MIDPYFLDRLENWSRAIRSAKKCNTSSMYRVMEVLRQMHEPDDEETGEDLRKKSSEPRTVDAADADLLNAAYQSDHLSPGAREYLRLAFGECLPEARCARAAHQSVTFYRECLEAVVARFQFIVETYFDKPKDSP